jgi:cellulose synthase/poly-beta-1,6-N-acetylglucosamine synthase-like glycosyltransferase
MHTLASVLLVYYLGVMAVICVYGLHRYWMVWSYLRVRRRAAAMPPAAGTSPLPRVTVQLPMYNEPYVAERVIAGACAMDYPRELLEIQVLDDSTDETPAIARRCCEQLARQGHDITYLHRQHRRGYKAGALAEGLARATGELVAMFDADFVPTPDLIRRTLGHFEDPKVGMVQARWGHLNRERSLLTGLQAMFLNGHFLIEQTARAHTGRWFNFNGTAGVWRRSCIDDAGGWQHDTLTEDTDISYRAQLRGWRFVYDPQLTCEAELPPTLDAFLTQQHRWNKGLIQTGIKLLPAIFRSRAPLKTKVEAWFHLTSPLVYVAILLLALIAAPALMLGAPLFNAAQLTAAAVSCAPLFNAAQLTAAATGLLCLMLGTVAAATFYLVSESALGIPVWRTTLRLPVLFALGVGISLINSVGVVEAIFGRQSPFVRTPKFGDGGVGRNDPDLRRRLLGSGALETALGIVMLLCFGAALSRSYTLVGAPFLLLFACGFLGVGLRGFAAKADSRQQTADSRKGDRSVAVQPQ